MDRARVLSSLAATATTNDVVIVDRGLWAEILDTISAIKDGKKDWPDLHPEKLDRLIKFPGPAKRGELLRISYLLRSSPSTIATMAAFAYLRKALRTWEGLADDSPK
jgi:hypothetical protein